MGFEPGVSPVAVTSNADSLLARSVDICIFTDTGTEVVTGSTRMKAGTAQKLVLNALSTGAMIKTGKVYENLMINLRPTNEKLRRRVISIVREILDVDEDEAVHRLDANEWNIKAAVSPKEA
jgi:N-acetylmuramic acid 6-phosphate etherase